MAGRSEPRKDTMNELTWLPIDSAPKDGSVVLTNEGLCLFNSNHWYLCYKNAELIYRCGCDPYIRIRPTHWLNVKLPWSAALKFHKPNEIQYNCANVTRGITNLTGY